GPGTPHLEGTGRPCLEHGLQPRRQTIGLGQPGGGVKIWDVTTHPEPHTFGGNSGPIRGVVYSPDGKRLATGGKVWDAQTGQELFTLQGHTDSLNRLAFSRDGKRLASASQDKTVKVWDAQTGQEILTCKGHTAGVS